MCQLDKLQELKNEIYRIAKKHKAEKIYVFGSCARKEETPESDIDFIVKFNDASAFDHIRLESELSEFLKKNVDVVSILALKDDYFGTIAKREMIPL